MRSIDRADDVEWRDAGLHDTPDRTLGQGADRPIAAGFASKEPSASVSAVARTTRADAVSPRSGHASAMGSRAAVPRSATNATPVRSSDSITEREANAQPSPAATRPSWAWSDVTRGPTRAAKPASAHAPR